jgi:hypothetical protein
MRALTGNKREFRARILKRRTELFQNMADELANPQNSCSLMKYIKCCKARKERTGCKLDKEKIDQYAGHFLSTFGGEPAAMLGTFAEITPDEIYNPYFGWEPVVAPGVAAGHPNPGLGMAGLTLDTTPVHIAADVISEQLKYLAQGKAAGIDKIMAEFYIYGENEIADILSILFSKISKECKIPEDWRLALICPCYKNKGDIKDIKNYRPIALTCLARRLYERIISKELTPYILKLEDTQGGFRKNRSALHQVYVLQELHERNPDLEKVLLDMETAYDKVDRRILWYILKSEFNMPNHIIRRLRDLFDYNSSMLIINGKISKKIVNKRGLLQGSSLSPILFNFFINNLLKKLNTGGNKVNDSGIALNHLAFADDIILVAKNLTDIQHLLSICEEWAIRYGMKFAPSKCSLISNRERSDLYLYNEELATSKQATYLGVIFDVNGINWDSHVAKRINKAKQITLLMQSLGMNIMGIAPAASVNLYKTFIRPILEYGTALRILPRKVGEKLQKSQNQALRSILSGNRTTSINAMHKLLQIPKFEVRNAIINMSFIGALHNSTDRAIPAVVMYRAKIQDVTPALWLPDKTSLTKAGRSNYLWPKATLLPLIMRPLTRSICSNSSVALSGSLKKKIIREHLIEIDQGERNIAGAIEINSTEGIRKQLTAAAFKGNRRHRVTFSRWLIGAVANHQRCQLCLDDELSRDHAISCSQVEQEMTDKYGSALSGHDNSDQNKLDFLINKFRNGNEEFEKWAVLWISKILRLCRGFRQSENGFWSTDPDGIG